MTNLQWSKLNHLQLGKYAEYYMKMEFTSYGFEVYTSEVDDHGVDFIVKNGAGKFREIQVKASRNWNYVFAKKEKFDTNQDNLYLALLLFFDGELPSVFLIPAHAWNQDSRLLKGRDYEGKKSNPEWGINLSQKNMPLLEEYSCHKVMSLL